MTMAKLQSAIRDVREAMPGIALKLFRAPPEVRAAYRDWRAACQEHCKRHPGARAYAAYLDGSDMPPDVPPLLRPIMPAAPQVRVGDDAGALYRGMIERKQR